MRERLIEAGALVGQSDHGPNKSLYARDPDGLEFEVMWLVPPSIGETRSTRPSSARSTSTPTGRGSLPSAEQPSRTPESRSLLMPDDFLPPDKEHCP